MTEQPSVSDSVPTPKRLPGGLRLLLRCSFALMLIIVLGLLALREWGLPRIDEQRQRIAMALERATGVPVEIASLRAWWPGLRIHLAAEDVVLGEPQAEGALRLPRIEAELGWSSLWCGSPYFERIELFGPELRVVREADGGIQVAGVELGDGEDGRGEAGEWLMRQGRVAISDANLVWLDHTRKVEPLTLDEVDLNIERIGGRFRFGLAAQAVNPVASTFVVEGDIVSASPGALTHWDGQIEVDIVGARLDGLTPWVDYPAPVAGHGDLALQLKIRDSRPHALEMDFALEDFGFQLHPSLPALDAQRASGRLRGVEHSGKYRFEVSGFEVLTRDGSHLEPTDLTLDLAGGELPQAAGVLSVDGLDLGVAAGLAAHLPLPEGVGEQLVEMSPHGRVEKLELEWEDQAGRPSLVRFAARFDRVGLQASGHLPGGEMISGEIKGDSDGGRYAFEVADGALALPAVFPEERIGLHRFSARGGWSREENGQLAIRLDEAAFENDDATGVAHGEYFPEASRHGVIDLHARIERANGAAVWRYLPFVVNEKTREWVEHGVVGGEAVNARLELRGPLEDFPFVDGGGVFRVEAGIEDGRLDYAEGWPEIEGIDGTLLFDGARMSIDAHEGRIFGVGLTDVRAEVPDLMEAGAQVMTINGSAHGPTADFLRYVSQSPVRKTTDGFTDGMQAEGVGDLALKLEMPLHQVSETAVQGSYRFSGNRVMVLEWLPPLERASGLLEFTEHAFRIKEGSGMLFGRPLRLTADTSAPGQLRFEMSGGASMNALRQFYDLPLMEHLSGETQWNASIDTGGGEAKVAVRSTLAGVSSSLPQPLNKRTADSLPLAFDMHFEGASRSASGSLGEHVRMALRGRSGERGFELASGGVGVGVVPPQPDVGLGFAGRFERLDLDAWRRLLSGGEGAGGVLVSVSLKAGQAHAFGKDIGPLALTARSGTNGWSGRIDSEVALGNFAWDGENTGALRLRLQHLVIAERDHEEERQIERALDPVQDETLPDLDVEAERFTLRGMDLGRLAVRAANDGEGWRLDSLVLESEDGRLEGSGRWRAGEASQTDIEAHLTSSNVGALLTRLGYPEAVSGGSVGISGRLSWAGAPTRMEYSSLGGTFEVEAKDGRFAQLEPGVGRLLGVLSLQSLPRRLRLDFSDVFSEGFAFDRISGEVRVSHGELFSDNLEIEGPAANVWINGVADINRETQDLTVVVQPTLSESVAAGAAIGLVNPAAGVIAYLAQKILQDPIERMFAYGYRITGNWSDPQVERLPVGQGATGDGKEGDGIVPP